jgi:predicted nucleic acid-binding protein
MKKMRIYLDNCCYNRPYDDQSFEIIRLETEAKLYIQDKIRDNKIERVWSFILDYENSENPYEDQTEAMYEWKKKSAFYLGPLESVRKKAKDLIKNIHLKPKDALHLACAVDAHCDYLLTTDKYMIKKTETLSEIKVINPLDFILLVEAK